MKEYYSEDIAEKFKIFYFNSHFLLLFILFFILIPAVAVLLVFGIDFLACYLFNFLFN